MNVRFEGLESLLKKLDALANVPKRRDIYESIGQDIRAEVSPYPPSTEANAPRPGGWYERGYGPRWYGGRKGRRTSQQLDKQWFIVPTETFVWVGNRATYATYVHGALQTWFHRARGWKRLKESTEALMPKIIANLEKFVNRIIGA